MARLRIKMLLLWIYLKTVPGQLTRSQLCDTGVCLVASFADPLVVEVRLTKDIHLKEEDFAEFNSSIVLGRDFTLTGIAARPVTLDLNFLRGKIRLKPNVTWYFSNLTLYRYRSGSGFQAPGLDLLEPLPPSERAWLHLDTGFLLSPFCFPVKILKQALTTVTRPPEFDGMNIAQVPGPLPAPPPDCINDTSAPALDRCYPMAAVYQDFGFYGADVQSNGVMRQSGYLIHFFNWTFLCPTVLSDDCIAKLGPVGCVLFTLSGGRASGPPPPVSTPGTADGSGSIAENRNASTPTAGVVTAADGAGAQQSAAAEPTVSGSDSDGGKRLAIILGCVVGGLGVLAVIAAMVALRRARARARQHRGQQPWTARSAAEVFGPGASHWHANVTPSALPEADGTLPRCPSAPFLLREVKPVPHPERPELALDRNEGDLPGSCPSGPLRADLPGALAAPAVLSSPGGPDATRSATDCAPVTETTTAAVVAATCAFAALTSSTSTSSPVTSLGPSGPGGAIVTANTPLRPDLRFGVKLRTIGLRSGSSYFRSLLTQQGSGRAPKHPAGRPDAVPAAAGSAAAAGVQAMHDQAMPVPLTGRVAGGQAGAGSVAAGEGDGSGGGGRAVAAADNDVVTLTPRVLGKGASGRVYAGEYRGAPVAVKVLLGFSMGLEHLAPPALQGQQQQTDRAAEAVHVQNDAGAQQSPTGLQALLPPQDSHRSSASGHASLSQQRRQQQQQRKQRHHPPQQPSWPQAQGTANVVLILDAEPVAAGASTSGGATSVSLESSSGYGSFFAGSGGNRTRGSGRGMAPALCLEGQVPAGDSIQLPLPPTSPALEASAVAAVAAAATAAGTATAATIVDPGSGGSADHVAKSPSVVVAATANLDPADDPRFNALFQQEVEVLGRCQHPNIVRLVAACVTPPRLCLVMELMEGSLERVLYGGTVRVLLALDKILYIAAEVCHGLAYLHPTIIHRDLKPANVLINNADSATPVVKLSDFGLARIRSVTIPTERVAAGTPSYLAPECYDTDNKVVTHHVDMFSLGVLLWTMLTGQEPWKNHTAVAVGYKVAVLGERLPLEQLSSRRCPVKLRQLIRQCWERDPRRRPAAAELAKELLALRDKVLLGVPTRRNSTVSSALTVMLRSAGAAIVRSLTAGASRPAGSESVMAVLQPSASCSAFDSSRMGAACNTAGGGGAEDYLIVRAASALDPGSTMGPRQAAGRLPLVPAAASDAAAYVAAAGADPAPAVGNGPQRQGEVVLALSPSDRLQGVDCADVQVCGEVQEASTASAAVARTAAENPEALGSGGVGGRHGWQEGLKTSSSDSSLSEGTLNRMMADVELELEME